jgi:3-deoxy-D-manno-octulosonic-acid transferase
LIWLHGASVGESLVLLTLVESLSEARADLNFLVTTGTTTSAALMAERLPDQAIHQFIPIDSKPAAAGFLDHWAPDLAVFAESELWPNLIIESARRSLPMALVNARMNEKSLRNWEKRRRSARWLLACFDWIGPADQRTADGLSALRGEDLPLIGNLKLEARPLPADPALLAEALGAVGDRKIWLAASTHEGEEEIALSAHDHALKDAGETCLLILAPRHPERGDAVEELIAARGFKLARRSRGEFPNADTQVWLADTLGEMPLWYAMAPAAFIGGSLIDGIGGHNPIEVSQGGSGVISGAFTASFDDVYAAYDRHGARIKIEDATGLYQAIETLWSDRDPALNAAHAALQDMSGGALDKTMGALLPLLPSGQQEAQA